MTEQERKKEEKDWVEELEEWIEEWVDKRYKEIELVQSVNSVMKSVLTPSSKLPEA